MLSNSSNKVSDAPGRSLAFISADRESTLSSSRDAVAHAVNPRVNHVHELILQPDPVFFVVRCPYRGPLNYSTDIIDCPYTGAGAIIPCLDLSRSRINANGVTLLSPVMQMRDRRFRLARYAKRIKRRGRNRRILSPFPLRFDKREI